MTTSDGSTEYTGGSVGYYKVWVANPTTPEVEPYMAECNDIIEALEMNYAEANVFKANWRRAAARQGKQKRGYTDGLYDAEKMVFFSERVVVQEKHATKHASPYPDTVLDLDAAWTQGEERIRNIASSHGDGEHYAEDMSDPANWRAGDLLEARTTSGDKAFYKGETYTVKYIMPNSIAIQVDSKGSDANGWGADNFRFHSRPSQVNEAEMSGIWISWAGGECPCDELSRVEVEFSDGEKNEKYAAKDWNWAHRGSSGEIIRYRML